MKSDVAKLLRRAEECLEEAHQLHRYEHYLGAINRAYYCIFDCARALLHEQGVFVKSHKGIQAKFGEIFIKTGALERKYADAMRHVFELRQACDYDFDAELTQEDAAYAIEGADSFLEATRQSLKA